MLTRRRDSVDATAVASARFGVGQPTVTEVLAELVEVNGGNVVQSSFEQDEDYELVLFAAGAVTRAYAMARWPGAVYVGSSLVGHNLGQIEPVIVRTTVDGASMQTTRAADSLGLQATVNVGGVMLEVTPARLSVYEHEYLGEADGEEKQCNVAVSVDAAGVVKTGVPAAFDGGAGNPVVIPCILRASDYSADVHDVGNRLVNGQLTYVVVGLWDTPDGGGMKV